MSNGADTGGAGSWSWWSSFGGLRRERPPPLRPAERQILTAAGYTKVAGKHARWRSPSGQVVKGKEKLHKLARQLRRAPVPAAPSPADVYVPTVVGAVAIPTAVRAAIARAAWRKLKAKRKKKLKAKLPPKWQKYAAVLERIASRYPRVSRALRFTRGNVAAAAVFLAAQYGLEQLLTYRRAEPKLERIKITARRMRVPRIPRTPRRPALLPGTLPPPAPRVSRAPGLPGSAVRVVPRRLERIKITAKRLPEAKLERIKITARRMALPRPAPRPVSPWPGLISRGISAAQPYLLKLAEPRQPRTASEAWSPPETVGRVVPLTQVQPFAVPSPAAAKCKCPKPKRKPRGPRKRRAVCYKGSYVETATGLRKRKREQVPC